MVVIKLLACKRILCIIIGIFSLTESLNLKVKYKLYVFNIAVIAPCFF